MVRRSGRLQEADQSQGETFEQAALLEAREELGITRLRLTLLWEDFIYIDTPVRRQERFLLPKGEPSSVLRTNEVHQEAHIAEANWWSLREIKSSAEPVFPEGLADQLETRLGISRHGLRGD